MMTLIPVLRLEIEARWSSEGRGTAWRMSQNPASAPFYAILYFRRPAISRTWM